MCDHSSAIYLVNREHIKVCDVVLLSVFDSGSALLFINEFTYIFIYKLALWKQINQSAYSDANGNQSDAINLFHY